MCQFADVLHYVNEPNSTNRRTKPAVQINKVLDMDVEIASNHDYTGQQQ